MRRPVTAVAPAPAEAEQRLADPAPAAQGPMPTAVSAAENNAPGPLADAPPAARGRRVLSTAFVRVGPDGHLTLTLRDGQTLVLRDVTMGPRTYCGVRAGSPGQRFCGGYAEVVAARAGGGAHRD